MGIIDDLKAAGTLKMYFDFRGGTTNDLSENSWTAPTLSGASLVTNHLECNDAGYLEVPYNSGFVSETGSIIVLGNFKTEDGTDFPLWSLASVGHSTFFHDYWSFLHDGDSLLLKTPGTTYEFDASPYDYSMVSATFSNGSAVKFFLDEDLAGFSTNNYATGTGVGSPNFRVGFTNTGGTLNTTSSNIYAVVYTTTVLSETQIATLYKELSDNIGLLLYRDAGSSTYVAYVPENYSDKTYISTTHDCELGEVQETQLFLRNDHEDYYYTNVSISSESLLSPDDTLGIKTGWGVKLSSGSTQPTEAQWAAVDYGNQIAMSNIGSASASNTTTYQPFWVRIECPAGIMPTTKENISINVNFTRAAV